MLSIENLTRTEKLRMMEVLWDDLARDSVTLSSPEWHAQALKEVERELAKEVEETARAQGKTLSGVIQDALHSARAARLCARHQRINRTG